ncbi:MAG: FAD-binding protein [Desulfarculus sp.]|nr:MAG: FAD-binding protein [Desulfarculus sp.]
MAEKTVAVIGAGLAGMMAACAAQEAGAQVELLDRGAIGLGTNSAMSNGWITAPTPDYGPQQYVADTLEIGRGLNRLSYVQQTAELAPEAIDYLRSLGVELVQGAGYYAVQSVRQDVIRGVELVGRVAAAVRARPDIRRRTGVQVLEIIKDQGRAVGVRGLDKQGRPLELAAAAVVLAGGGAGAVYARNDNQRTTLGQAYLLAARAGLPLLDMEFVQFYPIVLAEPGLPSVMIYPSYPPQARLLDAEGQEVLERFGVSDINRGIKVMRDKLSAMMFAEASAGPLRMDLTQAPAEAWRRYPLALLGRLKFDFKNRTVAVAPGAHFCMGGVEIDAQAQTVLPGLFACGEVVWGLHGANRRGGNALCECLVSGRLAGRAASAFAAANPVTLPLPLGSPWAAGGPGFPFRELLKELKDIAWQQAGIERDAAGLELGLVRLAELAQRARRSAAQNPPPAGQAQNLDAAMFMVQAVLTASRVRKESRGALLRRDYPDQDDAAWLCNSVLDYEPASGQMTLGQRPVPAATSS